MRNLRNLFVGCFLIPSGEAHFHHRFLWFGVCFNLKIMERQLLISCPCFVSFLSLFSPYSWLCNRIQLLSYSHIITFHPQGLTVSLVWQKKPNYSLTLTLSLSPSFSLLLVLSHSPLHNQSHLNFRTHQHLFKRVTPGQAENMSDHSLLMHQPHQTTTDWAHFIQASKAICAVQPHHMGF